MSARHGRLSDAEVGIIKGFFAHYPGQFSNQDILSKFSVPARTINAGRISEIKTGYPRYRGIPAAAREEVAKFISGETKLHELAGELPALKGPPAFIFGGMVAYDAATLEVSTAEGPSLDYKVGYEPDSIPVYLKALASMANAGHREGCIVFGVSDAPPRIVGEPSPSSVSSQSGKWRDLTLEHFEPFFGVRFDTADVGGEAGQQTVVMARLADDVPPPPIICRKGVPVPEKGKNIAEKGGNKVILREGAVYYRYGDSTREIRYAEMRRMLDRLTGESGQ